MTQDEYAMRAAEDWISDYRRMVRQTREQVLRYAVVTDAGPQIVHGFKLLCAKAGIVRPASDFHNYET